MPRWPRLPQQGQLGHKPPLPVEGSTARRDKILGHQSPPTLMVPICHRYGIFENRGKSICCEDQEMNIKLGIKLILPTHICFKNHWVTHCKSRFAYLAHLISRFHVCSFITVANCILEHIPASRMFLLISFWPGTDAANSTAFLGDSSIAQRLLLSHPGQISSRPWDKKAKWDSERTGPLATEAEENFLTRWSHFIQGENVPKITGNQFLLKWALEKALNERCLEVQTLWKVSTALTSVYWFLARASVLQKPTFTWNTNAKNIDPFVEDLSLAKHCNTWLAQTLNVYCLEVWPMRCNASIFSAYLICAVSICDPLFQWKYKID